MQAIRHLALGVCVLCALAGVVRIFWPENSYKPVINTVLLLYIVSSVLSVGSTADWAGFRAGWYCWVFGGFFYTSFARGGKRGGWIWGWPGTAQKKKIYRR